MVSQLDSVLPDEKRKELIRDKLGPLVKKINPTLGEKIIEELMKLDISKLTSLVSNETELKEKVDEEAKKIEEEENKKETKEAEENEKETKKTEDNKEETKKTEDNRGATEDNTK